MRTNLYLSWYFEKDDARRAELEKCFNNNFKAGYDKIWLFIEEQDEEYVNSIFDLQRIFIPEVEIIINENRAVVNDYVLWANRRGGDKDLHIFSNSDIYVTPETLTQIKDYYSQEGKEKVFMALSRWDQTKNGNLVHLDRWDSQDLWVFKSHCNVTREMCPVGFPGSDHVFADAFKTAGYVVINPSKTLQVIHLHLVKVYNYRDESKPEGAVKGHMICKEPYYFVNPTYLE